MRNERIVNKRVRVIARVGNEEFGYMTIKYHPDGETGLHHEMAERATPDWQPFRNLVPDYPAVSKSPRQVAKEIMEHEPSLQAKKVGLDNGIIAVRLRPTRQTRRS